MHFFTKFIALATVLATTIYAVPIACGGANQTPCPNKSLPGAALGLVSKEAARDVPSLAARIVCGGNSPIPCPDTPLPGAALGAVSKSAQARDDGALESRIACGGANQIPCPDTPLPGSQFGAVSKVAARAANRIPCGGTNQIPCPDVPIGGPITLPKGDGAIPKPSAAEDASGKPDASVTPEKRLAGPIECFVAPCPGDDTAGGDLSIQTVPNPPASAATPGPAVPQKRIAPITECLTGLCPDVNPEEGEVRIQTVPNPPAPGATDVSVTPKKRLPVVGPIECFVAPCPGDGSAATSGPVKRRSGMRRVSGGVNAIL